MNTLILKILAGFCAVILALLSYFQVISWSVVFPIVTALLGFIFGSEAEKKNHNSKK